MEVKEEFRTAPLPVTSALCLLVYILAKTKRNDPRRKRFIKALREAYKDLNHIEGHSDSKGIMD